MKTKTVLFTLTVSLLVIISTWLAYQWLKEDDGIESSIHNQSATMEEGSAEIDEEEDTEVEDTKADLDIVLPPAIDKASLEDLIGSSSQTTNGDLSVVIYDLQRNEELVSLNDQELYFTASLYKLYMNFLAQQDVEAGRLDLHQAILEHRDYGPLNLNDCLHLMVQLSDSPCGEAVLALYDYQEVQSRLQELGLLDINMPAFLTSARDMTQLLKLIYKDGLSTAGRDRILHPMSKQVFSQILRSAFSQLGPVYNKVGYSNNPVIWHDIAIIELEHSQQALVIVIMTRYMSVIESKQLADGIAQILAEPEENIPNAVPN